MSTVNDNNPTTSTTATDLESYQKFALEQQAQNNAWSAEQAQKQMDFQREMSNTAHQREVNDLKAAGLNPILSVNSGASVPNGAAGDTDTSASGNVGAILQQVLQAQSAREVAGMYNAATLAAASIAANASMYGSDMSYWNSEDHPKSAEEVAARALWSATHAESAHAPTNSSSSASGKINTLGTNSQSIITSALQSFISGGKTGAEYNSWARQQGANFAARQHHMSNWTNSPYYSRWHNELLPVFIKKYGRDNKTIQALYGIYKMNPRLFLNTIWKKYKVSSPHSRSTRNWNV